MLSETRIRAKDKQIINPIIKRLAKFKPNEEIIANFRINQECMETLILKHDVLIVYDRRNLAITENSTNICLAQTGGGRGLSQRICQHKKTRQILKKT